MPGQPQRTLQGVQRQARRLGFRVLFLGFFGGTRTGGRTLSEVSSASSRGASMCSFLTDCRISLKRRSRSPVARVDWADSVGVGIARSCPAVQPPCSQGPPLQWLTGSSRKSKP